MVLFVLLFLSASLVNAKSITRLSGIPELEPLKEYYSVPNFKIGGTYEFGNEASYEFGGKGGVTLESLGQKPLRTSYIAVGTPKRDANGKIINAVIFNSYYSADSSMMFYFWYEGQKGNEFAGGAVVGPGKIIDTNKYYVIFLDALGLWGASKPSDGLGMKFPKYSNFDYVQASYRLLKDGLGVAKVKLSTGASMGAIQSYIWAVLHPDFVEAIMPIAGATAMDPRIPLAFPAHDRSHAERPGLAENERQLLQPAQGKTSQQRDDVWLVCARTNRTHLRFQKQATLGCREKEVFYWEPKGDEGANLISKAKDFDVNDLLYRNMAGDTFNINDQLQRIKAKTLILQVKTDQWLRYAMAEESVKKIPGAKLAGYGIPLPITELSQHSLS